MGFSLCIIKFVHFPLILHYFLLPLCFFSLSQILLYNTSFYQHINYYSYGLLGRPCNFINSSSNELSGSIALPLSSSKTKSSNTKIPVYACVSIVPSGFRDVVKLNRFATLGFSLDNQENNSRSRELR
mmetsp:Transcript_14432/g.30704  ORF Transcript_14432/g.30704 Transcript_14432/m.30704 type:complete len:128 (+) Transcript_14432:187-570(+)